MERTSDLQSKLLNFNLGIVPYCALAKSNHFLFVGFIVYI